MRKIIYVAVLTVLISCKTIRVDNESQFITKDMVELGVVGVQRGDLLENDFEVKAIPLLEERIKLEVSQEVFTKKTFKAYLSAAKDTNALQLKYVDSLPDKPKFVALKLADMQGYVAALNKDEATKEYMYNQHAIYSVSSIAVVFSKEIVEKLVNADAVFLVSNKAKQYHIVMENNGMPQTSVTFNKGVVFAYGLSSPCWTADSQSKPLIKDLADPKYKCPIDSYRDTKKLKQKNPYEKYWN